eukprot:6489176-Amphidinium_carterae.1
MYKLPGLGTLCQAALFFARSKTEPLGVSKIRSRFAFARLYCACQQEFVGCRSPHLHPRRYVLANLIGPLGFDAVAALQIPREYISHCTPPEAITQDTSHGRPTDAPFFSDATPFTGVPPIQPSKNFVPPLGGGHSTHAARTP